MPEKPELKWEKLNSSRMDSSWLTMKWETHRARVYGGWLVLVRGEGTSFQSITFFPDPEHQWTGGTEY